MHCYLPHGKGQTSVETASPAPGADKGLDEALWGPWPGCRTDGEVEQGGRKMGGERVLPQGHSVFHQIGPTDEPGVEEKWMGILSAHLEKLLIIAPALS